MARLAEADEACTRSIALVPNHRAALTNRGALLLRSKRFADALPVYQQLLTIESGNPKAHLEVANLAAHLGNFELAKQEFHRTLELEPNNREASQALQQLEPR